MRPSSRLDLVLVPREASSSLERPQRLLQRLREQGVVAEDGSGGPEADRWIPGGFSRLVLDVPRGLGFWANRQGGFSARCPLSGDPVVAAFSAAMSAWRSDLPGPPPRLDCPSCGGVHPADTLAFRPPAAFGPWALVTGQAQGPSLSPEAWSWVAELVGACALVLRRG